MMWIPVSIYYPLLSSFSGMAQAGELKALMNFASPVLQACAALTPLMLPYAVRVLEEKGDSGISFALRRMTLLCVSGVVPYWLVLLVFKGPAFRMLYSGRYTEVANLLPIVALVSLFGGAFYGPSNTLRSMGLPRLVFAAVSVSTCISIAIGIPLTRNLGVKGAVWSMTLSEALSFVSAVVLLRRMARGALQSVPTVPVLSTSK
jgi:O-antigen/teichoic acid export membrane protein